VFLGATMSVETTAAAAGEVGQLRFDPFAMLPFCGYNMADYFGHWLRIGRRSGVRLPRVYLVNWFRKDDEGSFIWPGFGENSRVLEWIARRCDGEADAAETPIGRVPAPGAINTEGLDLRADDLERLLAVDTDDVRRQLPQVEEHLARFGGRLPEPLRQQLEALRRRLEG
jgi:phosphoenolpyruvate carboxykinase (GTP)